MADINTVDTLLNNNNDELLNLKHRNSMNDSLNILDNQLIQLEESNLNYKKDLNEESFQKDKTSNVEKFSSIPSMMKCYICEDYCEDAVQITCCYENFCDKHIKEEIMKNFTCPNCKVAATMRDIIPNKKLRENIQWYKLLLMEPLNMTQNNLGTSREANVNISINQMPRQSITPYHPNNFQIKKTDNLDKIRESNEVDMTPEEKMQLYNKLNEADASIKPFEDKAAYNITPSLVDQNKSLLENSMPNVQEKPIVGSTKGSALPFATMGGVPVMPLKPDQAAMMYYQRYDPRIYYSMMGYQYGPMGMYPIGVQPGDVKHKKSEKSSSSSSSSQDSRNSDKHSKKKRRSRSRHRKRDRSKKREKDLDKERDRHREKGRDRHKDKEMDKEREKDRKEKDRERDKDRDRDKGGEKDRDKDKDKKKHK